MNKFLRIFNVSVLSMLLIVFSLIPLNAEEIESVDEDEIYHQKILTEEGYLETFEMVDWTFNYFENIDKVTIEGKSNVTGETSFVFVNKKTGEYTTGESEASMAIFTPYSIYGPFKTYYDINANTVGTVIGLILGVASFVATAGASGIGLAALKSGLSTLFGVAGNGGVIDYWLKGASVNGYFEYQQEVDFPNCRARNLNRKVAMRVSSGTYRIYSYGNGSWFETARECY